MMIRILLWLIGAVLSTLVTLISIPLAPFLAAYATINRRDRLNGWMRYFETNDNDLDGDNGWHTEHMLLLESKNYGLKRWLKRWLWLWRNPAYTFGNEVCGAKIEPGMPIYWAGDPAISNRPGKSGRLWIMCGPYWCYYRIFQWGKSGKCLRIYLGWKLKPLAESEDNALAFPRYMLVLYVNPFCSFETW